MRHQKRNVKLGRDASHRKATLSAIVCSLIERNRIRTTVPKAKAARSMAERMVTQAKKGTLGARRLVMSRLRRPDAVAKLFDKVAPAFADRPGGYTRIVRIGERRGDSAEMALLEWVNFVPETPKAEDTKADAKKDK